MSRAIEDYLKTIYHLHRKHEQVETSVLARRLNVAASSATVMAQRLAKKGLVDYQPYAGVTLTHSGEKEALSIVRRHRLLECWLVKNLGVPWERAHAEAEHLEHAFSDALIDRIEVRLKRPTTSPYGAPIPNRLGQVARVSTTRLSELPVGQKAHVYEVSDHDAELLSYLARLRLYPGTVVCLLGAEPFGGSLRVEINGVERDVGRDAASYIFVTH